jgi:hypothetical protein
MHNYKTTMGNSQNPPWKPLTWEDYGKDRDKLAKMGWYIRKYDLLNKLNMKDIETAIESQEDSGDMTQLTDDNVPMPTTEQILRRARRFTTVLKQKPHEGVSRMLPFWDDYQNKQDPELDLINLLSVYFYYVSVTWRLKYKLKRTGDNS